MPDDNGEDILSKYVKNKSQSAKKEPTHIGGGVDKRESLLDRIPKINRVGLDSRESDI